MYQANFMQEDVGDALDKVVNFYKLSSGLSYYSPI